jgi:hypothetical protein
LDPTIPAVEVERSSIVVSPNPFISEVTAHLSLDKPQRVQINLTDVTGRLIQSVKGVYGQGSSEVRLNLSTAQAGVYVIKVAGENFTSTHKIVKR